MLRLILRVIQNVGNELPMLLVGVGLRFPSVSRARSFDPAVFGEKRRCPEATSTIDIATSTCSDGVPFLVDGVH